MILFYAFYVILLIEKLMTFLIRGLFFNKTILLVFLIVLLSLLLSLLWKYPKIRFIRLSQLRKYRLNAIQKYAITTVLGYLLNNIILITYIFIFALLIFYLRVINSNNVFDLKHLKKEIYNIFLTNSLLNNILIVAIIFLVILLYFLIMIRIMKYFKFHILKWHLFNMNNEQYYLILLKLVEILDFKIYIATVICKKVNDFYNNYVFNRFVKNINHSHILKYFLVEPYLFTQTWRILSILKFCVYKGHYLVFILIFSYDILYNNYIIKYTFHVLPIIFIYDVIIRLSIFISQLHLPSDVMITKFLYKNVTIIDKETAYFGDMLINVPKFKTIYDFYIKRGFIWDDKNLFKL